MKAPIAGAVALCGAAALVWGLTDPAAPRPAQPLGIVALIIGTLMALNYLYAWSLIRKMRRGEGVIERWTVAPASFNRFRDAERARNKRKNNWRMPRADWPDGLPVIFSQGAVLAGHTYFRLAGTGMSRFSFARIKQDAVPSVEFAMRLTIIGAGTQGRTARYRGHLRVPVADGAAVQAARIVAHFQNVVEISTDLFPGESRGPGMPGTRSDLRRQSPPAPHHKRPQTCCHWLRSMRCSPQRNAGPASGVHTRTDSNAP